MNRANVRPVPDPEPDEDPVPAGPLTITVDLPELGEGKRVIMLAELDGEDFLTLYRLAEIRDGDKASAVAMYGPLLAMMDRHCLEHNLDGDRPQPIVRRPMEQLLLIWRRWNEAASAAALDPTFAGK